MIPQRKPDGAAFAVASAKRVLIELPVFFCGAAKQIDFFGVEHSFL